MRVLIFLFFSLPLFADDIYVWQQISGSWKNEKIGTTYFLYDNRSKSYNFNYTELNNNNSIISINSYKYDKIAVSIKPYNPSKYNTFAIYFNSPGDRREFEAFRFIGSKDGITSVEHIVSTINDTSLPKDVKLNFSITVLDSKEIHLPFSESHLYEINFNRKNTVLLIDGNETMKVSLAKKRPDVSQFGIYHNSNLVKIYNFSAFYKNEVILTDNFEKSTVRKSVANVTIESR